MSLLVCALALGVFASAAWLFDRALFRECCFATWPKAGTDQKCPYCDTWQAEVGGWAWVGNNDNPMVDFAAECAKCGMYSDWVWIGPGVCAAYEEITKQQVSK